MRSDTKILEIYDNGKYPELEVMERLRLCNMLIMGEDRTIKKYGELQWDKQKCTRN